MTPKADKEKIDLDIEHLFSARARGMKASVIRELLKLTNRKDLVLFAGGLPNPAAFPVGDIKKITNDLLGDKGDVCLQYGTTEGLPDLREDIAGRMGRRHGIDCGPEDVMITSGAQQGLDLVSKTFLDPEDIVVVGAPTYLGGAGVFLSYQAQVETVPVDAQGMQTDVLEDSLWKLHRHGMRSKFIYVLPTFQNPSGVTMPEKRRKKIIDIASDLGMLVLEDDPYGEIRFSGEPQRPIKSFDKDGLVIYLGTFSKILAPGLRVAWLIAPPEVHNKLVIAKQSTDLCTNTFGQHIAHEYLSRGMVDRHVVKIKALYKTKRDIMLRALKKEMPDDVKWTEPDGGMFLWVTAPEGVDTVRMFDKAIANNVAYVPGTAFYPNEGGNESMRLNFTHPADDMIPVGIKRLAEVLEEEIGIVRKSRKVATRDENGIISGV